MSFTTACPNCDARLQAPDTVEGKRVKCKKCGEAFVARPLGDDDDRPARPAQATAKPRPRPAADDEDDEPRRPSKTSRRDDDEEEDRPRRRPRDANDEADEPRPKGKNKGKKKKKPAGSPVLLFVLIGVGALVLIGGGIGAYFAFFKEDKPEPLVTKGEAAAAPIKNDRSRGVADEVAGGVEIHEPEGRYRVTFPAAPTAMNPQAKSPEGMANVKMHMLSLPASQEGFLSLHEMVPPGTPADALFDKAIELVKTQAPGASVGDLNSITHQGHDGREFILTLPGKKEAQVVRMIAAGDRLIVLVAIGPNASPSAPRVKGFFESLKIE